jgi:hypothetical protein
VRYELQSIAISFFPIRRRDQPPKQISHRSNEHINPAVKRENTKPARVKLLSKKKKKKKKGEKWRENPKLVRKKRRNAMPAIPHVKIIIVRLVMPEPIPNTK